MKAPLPRPTQAPTLSRRPRSVLVRNHQRIQAIDTRFLARGIRVLLEDFLCLPSFDLSIQIVEMPEIVSLNETFLRHAGATDVIAFDYREEGDGVPMFGEVFVCLPVAIQQSHRFRTSWQAELVRYAVHGVLHLCGYQDANPGMRRCMKRVEDRALSYLAGRFKIDNIGGPHLVRARRRTRRSCA